MHATPGPIMHGNEMCPKRKSQGTTFYCSPLIQALVHVEVAQNLLEAKDMCLMTQCGPMDGDMFLKWAVMYEERERESSARRLCRCVTSSELWCLLVHSPSPCKRGQ